MRRVLALSLLVSVAGCTDDLPIAPTVGLQQLEFRGYPSLREQDRARAIAVSLRDALGDPEAREELLDALASSAHPEGKLHLRSFLQGRAPHVRAATTRRGRWSELLSNLDQVRDLELYVPVRSHRDAITGETVPIVAVALSEEANPLGLLPDGTERLLPRDYPPAQPVLVLAPGESDLRSQAMLNAQGKPEVSCVVERRETLGEARERCHGASGKLHARESARGDGAAVGHNLSGLDGMYLEHLELVGDQCHEECWAWGDPEYEIHLRWNSSNQPDPGEMRLRQCVGHHAPWEYTWNMDGSRWTQLQRLMTGAQLEDAATGTDSAIVIEMWEDDATACVIKVDSDVYPKAILATIANGWATLYAFSYNTVAGVVVGAVMAYLSIPALFLGGDDYIGVFLPAQANFPATSTTNTTLVKSRKGTDQVTGRARIKAYSNTPPAPGPTVGVSLSESDGFKLPVGAGKQFGAIAVDANGIGAPLRTPSWSTSNGAIATVSSSGYVTANAAGSVTISATIDGVTNGVSIEVANYGAATRVELSPGGVSVSGTQQVQLYARLYDSNDFELSLNGLEGAQFEYAYPGVCHVSPAGVVTALTGSSAWTDITIVTDGGLRSNTIPCSVNGGNAYLRAPTAGAAGKSVRARP